MRVILIVLVLVTLGVTPAWVAADIGEPPRHVIDVDGALLVGTYPLAIGELDDGEPIPDLGLDPVSKAVWPFTTEPCFLFAEILLSYASAVGETVTGAEEAILRVRLMDHNDTALGDWFATGGHLHQVHPVPLETNQTYAVEVHHMVGPRVTYDLDVWLYHFCPE